MLQPLFSTLALGFKDVNVDGMAGVHIAVLDIRHSGVKGCLFCYWNASLATRWDNICTPSL